MATFYHPTVFGSNAAHTSPTPFCWSFGSAENSIRSSTRTCLQGPACSFLWSVSSEHKLPVFCYWCPTRKPRGRTYAERWCRLRARWSWQPRDGPWPTLWQYCLTATPSERRSSYLRRNCHCVSSFSLCRNTCNRFFRLHFKHNTNSYMYIYNLLLIVSD